MQTYFSLTALADPDTAECEQILRACVHCGFCTATCPTYLLTGDELDSPRGRIYLIKDMLETARPADALTVKHLDRCLSCLSCMTTCPSSVHYMHLIDHARTHIEKTFRRVFFDRALRVLLSYVLPRPTLFRMTLRAAKIARPIAPYLPKRLGAMLALIPPTLPPPSDGDRPQVFPVHGVQRCRVALLNGCAQTVLDTRINAATVRLLTRLGAEVVIAEGAGCCGALAHHLGRTKESYAFARRNIEAWTREIDGDGLDYVVINASGCGTIVKDYGFMFRNDPELATQAASISSRAVDVCELVAKLGFLPQSVSVRRRVAYHAACSLQHGQKITQLPIDLLTRAGFDVVPVPEGHICCGSAGIYNLLQPDLAAELRVRKVVNIESVAPDVVAAGNLGCMTQISAGTDMPVVHTVELLDWASGGPRPAALEDR